MKKMSCVESSDGKTINLSIERDAGNPVLILMGGPKNCEYTWKRLYMVCLNALDTFDVRKLEVKRQNRPSTVSDLTRYSLENINDDGPEMLDVVPQKDGKYVKLNDVVKLFTKGKSKNG